MRREPALPWAAWGRPKSWVQACYALRELNLWWRLTAAPRQALLPELPDAELRSAPGPLVSRPELVWVALASEPLPLVRVLLLELRAWRVRLCAADHVPRAGFLWIVRC